MLTKLQIAKAIAVFVITHDLVASYQNKSIFEDVHNANLELGHINQMMIDANVRLAEDLGAVTAQKDYLIHVLNENDITPSEFDLIALRNPLP